MSSSVLNVAIWVSDLERSIDFYTSVIGLERQQTIETDEFTEVFVGGPDGGAQIALVRASDPETPAPSPAGIFKIFVQVDDAPERWKAAAAAGWPQAHEPTYLDEWGLWIAFTTDPDGYVLELGSS